jgi:hypothetical protein
VLPKVSVKRTRCQGRCPRNRHIGVRETGNIQVHSGVQERPRTRPALETGLFLVGGRAAAPDNGAAGLGLEGPSLGEAASSAAEQPAGWPRGCRLDPRLRIHSPARQPRGCRGSATRERAARHPGHRPSRLRVPAPAGQRPAVRRCLTNVPPGGRQTAVLRGTSTLSCTGRSSFSLRMPCWRRTEPDPE